MKRIVRFTLLPLAALAVSTGFVGCQPKEMPAPSAKSDAVRKEEGAAPIVKPTPAPEAASTPTPAPPAPEAAATTASPAAMTPEGSTAVSTPAATPTPATPGVALDAKTIVGTKWSAAGYELAFLENGALKVNGDTDGTWKLDGTKLTVDVGGTPYEAQLEGDKITYDGSPLEKLN